MNAGGKILLVDDNKDFRTVLRTALESKGYDIFEAGDGEEALDLMNKTVVHMAIVDLDMPRMNGIEFSKHVKTRKPDFPIIMMTAYAQFYSPGEILSAGVDAFLQKPVDLERLTKAILQL